MDKESREAKSLKTLAEAQVIRRVALERQIDKWRKRANAIECFNRRGH